MHRPGAFERRPPGGRKRSPSFEAIFTLFFIGLIFGLPTSTNAQQVTICPADVALLIDASYREGVRPGGSWDRNIKNPAKAVIEALVRHNPPQDGNRIAAVRFGQTPNTLWYLDRYRNANDMTRAIDAITNFPIFQPQRNIAAAVNLAGRDIFNGIRGDRTQLQTLPLDNNYVIIFMDGFSNATDFNNLQNAVTSLVTDGVTVMGVVGSDRAREQFRRITGLSLVVDAPLDHNEVDRIVQAIDPLCPTVILGPGTENTPIRY